MDARATNNLREARLKPSNAFEARSRIELKQRLNIDSDPSSLLSSSNENFEGKKENKLLFGEAELFSEQVTQPNVANLVFWSVNIEDSGKYTCSVDFKRSRSRHQTWQLQVLGEFSQITNNMTNNFIRLH